jgi:hypothetical protein
MGEVQYNIRFSGVPSLIGGCALNHNIKEDIDESHANKRTKSPYTA